MAKRGLWITVECWSLSSKCGRMYKWISEAISKDWIRQESSTDAKSGGNFDEEQDNFIILNCLPIDFLLVAMEKNSNFTMNKLGKILTAQSKLNITYVGRYTANVSKVLHWRYNISYIVFQSRKQNIYLIIRNIRST